MNGCCAAAFAAALACLLADCSTLPTAGPTVHALRGQAVENNRARFDIVDVDSNVVATLLSQPRQSLAARFKQFDKPPSAKIGIGDTVSVTIWEAAPGGLFGGAKAGEAATGATSVTIPAQPVGQDGAISVPYAGRISVAGRTPPEVSRGGITATIPMATLVSDPAENIYAWPGDVLTLILVPQSFSVLGAAGTNAQLNFTAEKMTLAEAIAKAGGLLDQRADPAGIFLFRYEPAAVVDALKAPNLATGPGGTSPVVYRIDLSDALAYFLAQRFPVEDKDIIFVANAQLNEMRKFFDLLSTLTGPVLTGVVIKSNVSP
jgi:polysaccharide export outer membrane protein